MYVVQLKPSSILNEETFLLLIKLNLFLLAQKAKEVVFPILDRLIKKRIL